MGLSMRQGCSLDCVPLNSLFERRLGAGGRAGGRAESGAGGRAGGRAGSRAECGNSGGDNCGVDDVYKGFPWGRVLFAVEDCEWELAEGGFMGLAVGLCLAVGLAVDCDIAVED